MPAPHRLSLRFLRHNFQFQLLRPAEHRQRTAHANASVGQQTVQVIYACDWFSIESDNHIALAQSCSFCRTAVRDRYDHHAALFRQIVKANQAAMKNRGLGFHPDVAAPDSAFLQQPARDKFRGIDSNRKTEPLRAHNGCSIDADDLSVGSHQRSAGVSGIERRIGLNDIFDQAA
jgi:hypothetical protein